MKTPVLSRYQLGFKTTVEQWALLERAFRTLPLKKAEARFDPSSKVAIVLADVGSSAAAMLQRPGLQRMLLGSTVALLAVDQLEGDARLALEREVTAMPAVVREESTAAIIGALRRAVDGGAPIALGFSDEDGLREALRLHELRGAMFVRAVRAEATMEVCLRAGLRTFAAVKAKRVMIEPPRGETGSWVRLELTEELRSFMAFTPVPREQRKSARVPVRLNARFKDWGAVRQQVVTNVSKGGMFVECEPKPEVGAQVTVFLELPHDEMLQLPAVVVRSEAKGVALKLTAEAGPTIDRLVDLVTKMSPRKPRVLVIDDEPVWRAAIARALEGHLFELDLVVADLHMPRLDGRRLLERIRSAGGERELKVLLFSAAPRSELEAAATAGANGFISKNDPLDTLLKQIQNQLPH